MNWIYLIIALIVGFGFGWFLKPKTTEKVVEKDVGFISESVEKKEENLAKARAYIRGKEKITNDELQKALGVSDATIVRYLNDLESEGLIKQVGKTGKYTYYEVL